MHANLSAFASRPISAARAMKTSLVFVMAVLGVVACRIAVANHAGGASAWSVAPQTAAASARSLAKPACFEAIVELDEGYGVTGRDTRLVCENAG